MVVFLPDGTRLLAGYVPSNVLSYIGCIVYGILTIIGFLHLFRMGRKFMITLLIGLTAMTGGFVCRILLHDDPGTLGVYMVTTLLLLLSPCAFLAADYVVLSRLSRHLGNDTVGQECLIIRPSLLVKLFCWSDGLTFFLQMSGGGLSAAEGKAELGKYITLVGLGIQLVSFSLFCITLVIFGSRVKSRFSAVWADAGLSPQGSLFAFWRSEERSDWTTLYFTLLATTFGIMLRCVFRFVEYTQGYDGYLASHEVFFYLLDALPLALAMGLFMIVWPPRFLPLNSYSTIGGASARKEEYLLSSR